VGVWKGPGLGVLCADFVHRTTAVIISHSFIYGEQSFDLSETRRILKTNACNLAHKYPKLSIVLSYSTDLLLIASHKVWSSHLTHQLNNFFQQLKI